MSDIPLTETISDLTEIKPSTPRFLLFVLVEFIFVICLDLILSLIGAGTGGAGKQLLPI